MKKSLLFITVILAMFLSSCSSTKSVSKNTAPGSELQVMWQLSKELPEKSALLEGYKPQVYSTYKIIDKCGNFTNIIHNNRGTNITAEGTYSFSESNYTEHVLHSFTSPEFSGKDNAMTYEIVDGKYLFLTYPVGGGKNVSELWVKVPRGNPLK